MAKRTTIVVAMLIGLVAGVVTGGRLLAADAQPRRAPVAAQDCAVALADRTAYLARAKRAERMATQAEQQARARALAAEARVGELREELEVTKAQLAVARQRLADGLRQIGPLLEGERF